MSSARGAPAAGSCSRHPLRRRSLRSGSRSTTTAATWPGAPINSLRFVVDELGELGGNGWREKARERVLEKVERLAAEEPGDVFEALLGHPLPLAETVGATSPEAYWSLAASLVVMGVQLSGKSGLFDDLEDDEQRFARQIELPALDGRARLEDVVKSLASGYSGALAQVGEFRLARPDSGDVFWRYL